MASIANKQLIEAVDIYLTRIKQLCTSRPTVARSGTEREIINRLIEIESLSQYAKDRLADIYVEESKKIPVGELDSETQQVTLPADLPTTA